MNPILWLLGWLSTLLIMALYLNAPQWLVITLAILLIIGVLTTVGVFLYFAIKAPDKLRSEEYQAKYDALQVYQKMQSDSEKTIDAIVKNPEIGGR